MLRPRSSTPPAALVVVLLLVATATSGCALLPFLVDGDDGSDVRAAVRDVDALVEVAAPAIVEGLDDVRWLGLSSDAYRCGGGFPVVSYEAGGDFRADDTSVELVTAAWEDAGLEPRADGDGGVEAVRGDAVVSYQAVGPSGSGIGRFGARFDCRSEDGDVIDDLEENAGRDFAAELDLPRWR